MESRDTISEEIDLEWDTGGRDWPDHPQKPWSLGIGGLHRELCICLWLVMELLAGFHNLLLFKSSPPEELHHFKYQIKTCSKHI